VPPSTNSREAKITKEVICGVSLQNRQVQMMGLKANNETIFLSPQIFIEHL